MKSTLLPLTLFLFSTCANAASIPDVGPVSDPSGDPAAVDPTADTTYDTSKDASKDIVTSEDGVLQRRDTTGATWYEVGDGLDGAKVWSSIKPESRKARDVVDASPAAGGKMQRREADGQTWHEVRDGLDGAKVWSSVAARDADGIEPRMDVEDITKWFVEHPIDDLVDDQGGLEKRASWGDCGLCLAICQVQVMNSRRTVSQKLQFCLTQCISMGSCTAHFSRRYQDTYHGAFAPPGSFPL